MQQSALAAFLKGCKPSDSGRPDDRLLADFFAHRDERAFAALVRRHERTVWGVCRRVLANPSDAEDAFQATFLILVGRGRTLADRGSIGGWLYRVAHRVALKMRKQAEKRRRRDERTAKVEGVLAEESSDLMAVIGEELERLSEVHRTAVIVCDLDGLSRTEAAVRLGCSEGTLSARLHRGRKQLADRLRLRGISTPLAGLIALAGFAANAPTGLGQATVQLAGLGLGHPAVSASVAALVSVTLKEMTMRFTTKVLAILAISTGLLGSGWLGWTNPHEPQAIAAPVPAVKGEAKVEIPGPAYDLLRHRKVLKDLKCTPQQRVAIEDTFDEQAEKRQPLQGFIIGVKPGNPIAPEEILRQFDAQLLKRAESTEAEAKVIAEKYLRRDQLVRLGQIGLQIQGVQAFADAKIADALKLTLQQEQDVKNVKETLEESTPMAVVTLGAGPEGIGAGGSISRVPAVAKKVKDALAEIDTILTKEQRATWKEMLGEKIGFDLPGRARTHVFGFGGPFQIPVPADPKKD